MNRGLHRCEVNIPVGFIDDVKDRLNTDALIFALNFYEKESAVR